MTIESGNTKTIFKNLQSLRGIAALMVCTFHYRFVLPEPFADILFGNGFIGVQIFFMISGFIMVHTTKGIQSDYRKQSLKFMINRFLRIAPLYYLSTFLLIADDLNDGYLAENYMHLIKSLLFMPTFLSQHGPDYGMPVVHVGWTLNYEMLFYILFAVSILFERFRYHFLFIIFFTVIILIPSLSHEGLTSDYSIWHNYPMYWLNLFTNPIWIHFVFGIITGLVLPRLQINSKFARSSFYVSIILFCAYYTGLFGMEINALNDLLFCGLLLIGFVTNDFSTGGIKAPEFLVKLGDMSYSLYLLHHLSLAYFQFICYKLDLRPFTESAESFLPSVVIALVVSWIIYRFIEKRMNKYLKNIVSGWF